MKAHIWIPRVLSDISQYARTHNLHDTARIIDQAYLVSMSEVEQSTLCRHLKLVSNNVTPLMKSSDK